MKRTLRQSIIAGRAALPENEHLRMSSQIVARLLELKAYRSARTILGYMHFGTEFVSEPWLQQVLHDGKRLLLPRVNVAERELEIYNIKNFDEQLALGSYDIREPVPGKCTPAKLDEIDFILLPGVAFGRDGARLGYGGGFYDKLLARLPHQPTLVAAVFEMQLVEYIPQEATDRKVEWLVTENEVIHCSA